MSRIQIARESWTRDQPEGQSPCQGQPAFPPAVMNRGERRKPHSSLCFEAPRRFMNHCSVPIGGCHRAPFRGENGLDVATALPAGGTFTRRALEGSRRRRRSHCEIGPTR